MSNYKQYILVVLGLLFGLSVIISQSGILKDMDMDIRAYTLFSRTTLLLNTVIVFLAWHHFRRTGHHLFKWISVSVGISLFLIVKNHLYSNFVLTNHLTLEPTQLSLIQQINTSITLGCNIIAALLIVYAIHNYPKKTHFLSFIKPCWLAVLVLIWLGSVIATLMHNQVLSQFSYLPLQIAIGVINFYGIKTSLKMYNIHQNSLFKWFAWIFLFKLVPILLGLINLAFIPYLFTWETSFFAFYNYLTILFVYGDSILLGIFLIRYRIKGLRQPESGKGL